MLSCWLRALFIMCFVLPANMALAAPGTVYDCAMSVPGGRGWIPPRILIAVSSDEKAAKVHDGIIETVLGGPIDASVSPRDDTSLYVQWAVDNIPSDIRVETKARYRAVLFKETGRVLVTAVLSSFDNEPRGSGSCTAERRNINF